MNLCLKIVALCTDVILIICVTGPRPTVERVLLPLASIETTMCEGEDSYKVVSRNMNRLFLSMHTCIAFTQATNAFRLLLQS